MSTCAGTRKDGQPCTAGVVGSGSYCFGHDPDKAERRAAARAKGGRNRSNAARVRSLIPARLVPIYDQIERALGEVHDGDIDPKVATAMASLARALVALVTAGEFEERLRKLEAGEHGT